MTLENLTERAHAEKSFYPNGTYGYSQIGPAVIKFPKPVQLLSVFLKQHRAPSFYLKKSNPFVFTSLGYSQHQVQAFYKGAIVLNAPVMLFSNMWK